MNKAILEYGFFQHFYISDKSTYETILCECLNASKKMVEFYGGKFSLINEQSNGQSDVIAESTNYEIDFKMMISESLKEFQSRTAPIVQELASGVKAISKPEKLQKKVVLIWNSCRNMNSKKLQKLRSENDIEAKAVTHFFDKVINKKKNILLFVPVYFSTVDKSLSVEEQHEQTFKELSSSMQYIYDFRSKNCSGYDTFLVYVMNIPQRHEFIFVISIFTPNGLELIDKIQMLSLKSVFTLAIDNKYF